MTIETRQSLGTEGIERRVVRWVMRQVGNPDINVRLWNGDEFAIGDGRPVACLEFRSPRAVVELLRAPSVDVGRVTG